MRVAIAPQEFKGSLTAPQAVDAIADGVRRVYPGADLDRIPLADGGPGTVEAVVTAAAGRYSFARVDGPLGDPADARWGRIDQGKTAVIEMAAASGLLLLPADRLDPRRAGTHGTGELIRAALDARVTSILVGLGGSATNDAGAGMAVALGANLVDDDGLPLPPGGAALARLARIDVTDLDPRLRDVPIVVLADVDNPLVGPDGATAVYGPQKGADAQAVAELERALLNFADIVERDLGVAIASMPGAGAAGGLAGGLVAFAGATIESGLRRVAQAVRLPDRCARADLVMTGEGRLDRQSAFGKTVFGVAGVALAAGTPCLAVAGTVTDEPTLRSIPGLAAFEAAALPGMTTDDAMRDAAALLADATERLLRRHRTAPTDVPS